MALDATEILGAPQIAGVSVNTRGMSKAMGSRLGGMYGGLIGAGIGEARAMKAERQKAEFAEQSETPKFGRVAWLAVTADEVALIDIKSKIVTTYLADLLARVPRSEVTSVTLEGGGMYGMPLTVTFANGETWELEVPKPSKKNAQRVVEEFAA